MQQTSRPTAVEICAGAGGQVLGLHRAGFDHVLAVELDATAAQTLRQSTGIEVAVGDVADSAVWRPIDYAGVDLLAGGVPCPPFSVAGRQLGSSDERDLFAWAVEQVAIVKPRALLLENVRGLAAPRFSGYRQRVLDRLAQLGYVANWRLLQAADFGVAQLRPRFVLVAMRPDDAAYFRWPQPHARRTTVGETIGDLMAENGWKHVDDWVAMANGVGPTLVGGSKKHGGADLGPTRAKAGWAKLAVDGHGIANASPEMNALHPSARYPRLTIPMAARLQGWTEKDKWQFAGRKTSQYRQIGNAFPPPVAEAIGHAIRAALAHEGVPHEVPQLSADLQDPVYRALATAGEYVSLERLVRMVTETTTATVEQRLAMLAQDFAVEVKVTERSTSYKLGGFKGFTGQPEHLRNHFLKNHRSRVS
ncbi:DNA cytosine methyltransferase [Microbacterium sp. JZ31]|uniref:DNA cytosine methyltransferase n=1 Tax=Microbacterium sp. JZ31 TaxID=1906274 RepID=UPI0019345374|nr:DNA (cytosine-5-)-methyltransferase [Microbacterium sp. JZ31]